MNTDEAKKVLPIIQALAEGKVIQYLPWSGDWEDAQDINPAFAAANPERFRIKPEPRRFALLVSTGNHPDGAGKVIRYWPEIHDAYRFLSSGWWEKVEVEEVLNG